MFGATHLSVEAPDASETPRQRATRAETAIDARRRKASACLFRLSMVACMRTYILSEDFNTYMLPELDVALLRLGIDIIGGAAL
eukprot:scaffold273362_cov18-Prasinocladus_malaysianus.AAC.1